MLIDFKDDDYADFVKPAQFITDKAVMYVCNVDEKSAENGNMYVEKVKNAISKEQAGLLFLAVSIESDINELESFEERQLFLDDLGLSEAGSTKLIKSAYDLLNQQTYFTAR